MPFPPPPPPFFNGTTHENCHFHVFSSPKHRQTYIFLHIHIYFIYFLKTTPTSNPKGGGGGHTTHAYSFSYWTTPNSGPKGGMCLKCTPLDPPMNTTLAEESLLQKCLQSPPNANSMHPATQHSMHLWLPCMQLHAGFLFLSRVNRGFAQATIFHCKDSMNAHRHYTQISFT